MSVSLASFSTIMTNPDIDVRTAVEALMRNIDRYVAVSPPPLVDQVAYVRDAVADIIEIIAARGYDVRDDQVRSTVSDAANGDPPYGNLIAAMTQIEGFERTAC